MQIDGTTCGTYVTIMQTDHPKADAQCSHAGAARRPWRCQPGPGRGPIASPATSQIGPDRQLNYQ